MSSALKTSLKGLKKIYWLKRKVIVSIRAFSSNLILNFKQIFSSKLKMKLQIGNFSKIYKAKLTNIIKNIQKR